MIWTLLFCYIRDLTFCVIVQSFLAAFESEFLRGLPYEVELVPGEEYRSEKLNST